MQIVQTIQSVAEKTPPELVGDIFDNGLVLTGGGAMINGLDKLITAHTRIKAKLAEDPVECVAKGTMMCFQLVDSLKDGFLTASTHDH